MEKEGLVYISGINSLFVYADANKKYFLFGDQHYEPEIGSCENVYKMKCDMYDFGFETSLNYGTSCWTIGSLVDELLTYNNEKKIITDVYLEVPFTKLKYRLNNLEEIIGDRRELPHYWTEEPSWPDGGSGWLNYIESYSTSCLIPTKKNCPYYPNVRFHYADTRATLNKQNSNYLDPWLSHDYMTHPFNLLTKIVTQMNEGKNKSIYDQDLISLISELKDIYKLYQAFFQQDFQIKLLLDSEDIENIIQRLKLPKINTRLINILQQKFSQLIATSVYRNSIKMHRTAAEFQRCLKFNPYIGQKIYQYAVTKIKDSSGLEKLEHILNILSKELTKDKISKEHLIQQVEEFGIWTEHFSIWTMDIYTLSRIFLYPDSQQVLILAGYVHIQNISDFLSSLNTEKLIDIPVSELDSRCIKTETLNSVLNLSQIRLFYDYPLAHHQIKIILDRFPSTVVCLPETRGYLQFLLKSYYKSLKKAKNFKDLSQYIRKTFKAELSDEILKEIRNFTFSINIMTNLIIKFLVYQILNRTYDFISTFDTVITPWDLKLNILSLEKKLDSLLPIRIKNNIYYLSLDMWISCLIVSKWLLPNLDFQIYTFDIPMYQTEVIIPKRYQVFTSRPFLYILEITNGPKFGFESSDFISGLKLMSYISNIDVFSLPFEIITL